MGSMMRKVRRANRKVEMLTVEDGVLYKADGTPVLTTDADAKYRKAYRKLFIVLEHWPLDGVYSFDGRRMKLVQLAPEIVKGD